MPRVPDFVAQHSSRGTWVTPRNRLAAARFIRSRFRRQLAWNRLQRTPLFRRLRRFNRNPRRRPYVPIRRFRR